MELRGLTQPPPALPCVPVAELAVGPPRRDDFVAEGVAAFVRPERRLRTVREGEDGQVRVA